MKLIIIIIIGVIVSTTTYGQKSSKVNFNGSNYYSYKIKVDAQESKRFIILDATKKPIKHNDFVTNLNSEDSTRNVMLSTASVVDGNGFPLGYYAHDGQKLLGVNNRNGNGNFYLKPNGAFLILDNDVVVCESSNISKYHNVRYGIQSGPMLVHFGVINSNFGKNSTNKQIRSAVGMYINSKGNKFIVFAISETPVSFYEFSEFFINKFKCTEVLAIESVRSVLKIPFLPNQSDNYDGVINRYIIYFNR